jgi:hypothetical protein
MSHVRWISKPDKQGVGVIRICKGSSDQLYALKVQANEVLLGKDDGTYYRVTESGCDCPDAVKRPRPEGCKHRRALKALGLFAVNQGV